MDIELGEYSVEDSGQGTHLDFQPHGEILVAGASLTDSMHDLLLSFAQAIPGESGIMDDRIEAIAY